MGEIIWLVCGVVGAGVTLFFTGGYLIEVLRCLYWAIWTLPPVVRAPENTKQATLWLCVLHVWDTFLEEHSVVFRYETRSCKYYSHGWFPWEPREWYS